jgi:transposase
MLLTLKVMVASGAESGDEVALRSRPHIALTLADRWHVCFYDLDGQQGMLGHVEDRTADDSAYWLAGATPAWRGTVQVVAIDMCAIFASAVRRMLPGARVAVDLFHVVQLAVKTVGDARRRAVRCGSPSANAILTFRRGLPNWARERAPALGSRRVRRRPVTALPS